jgi:hypothetical protein
MAYKYKKQRMPDGWVQVIWYDKLRQRWSSNMPKSAFKHFYLNLISKGGVISRTIE